MAAAVVHVVGPSGGADAPGVPDAVLAVRAAQGDREAFAALMVRHGGEVQRLCRRLVGNGPLAEDCAQDAWLLALLRLHRRRARSKVVRPAAATDCSRGGPAPHLHV